MRRTAPAHITLVLATLALVASHAEATPQIADIEVGLGGRFKLGAPTLVTATITDPGEGPLRLVAVAADNDGLPVATSNDAEGSDAQEQRLSVTTRLGKASASILLRLQQGDEVLDERRIRPGTVAGDRAIAKPLPAEAKLTLFIGGASDPAPAIATKVASIDLLKEAPKDWRAYRAAESVVLSAGGASIRPDLDREQLSALRTWVQRGGQMILSCGAAASELLTEGGPLTDFVPGDSVGVAPLRSTGPLEAFAGSNKRLTPTQPLRASRLSAVRGEVLAYDGPNREALPLVVRSPFGFGEVVFVAVDLNDPSIVEWSGRAALLDRLRDPAAEADKPEATTIRRKETALSDTLVRYMDSVLPGVSTVPLLAIVGIATLYLLAIGPLDWLLVTRWAGKPQLTWITFPAAVLLFGGVVIGGSLWLRGSACATASIEVREVECATQRGRSLLLTQIYSPESDRFDLALTTPGATDAADTSWFAASGGRLGGLSGASTLTGDGAFGGYEIRDGEAVGLPLAVASTKTLATEFYASNQPTITATLRPSIGGLVEGTVTNDTGERLADCQLWHNGWAWRLGTVGPGETKTIDDSGNLLRVTTVLGNQLDEREATADQLASILSFGNLVNRRRTAPANHLLAYWDLTHQLDANRAVLVGRIEEPKNSLRLTDGARLEDGSTQSEVFVRYLIDVSD